MLSLMIKPSIKYSVLCGVFLTGLFFVSIAFGSNPLIEVRHLIFDLAIFFLFIFFAGKEYKDVGNAGILHFWQGISLGIIVFIPAVIIFSLTIYIILELNPTLIDVYKKAAKALQESQRELFLEVYSEETLQKQIREVDLISSIDLVLKTFWKKLFAGFLVTPVAAIILRKKTN